MADRHLLGKDGKMRQKPVERQHKTLVCIPLSPVFSRHIRELPNFMDEATANVDPENEDRLQKAIEELTRNKAIIMNHEKFPGINLAFYSVHYGQLFFEAEEKEGFMEICRCREGRMEQEREKGSVYIMPGTCPL